MLTALERCSARTTVGEHIMVHRAAALLEARRARGRERRQRLAERRQSAGGRGVGEGEGEGEKGAEAGNG
jgi:hypothetical protein